MHFYKQKKTFLNSSLWYTLFSFLKKLAGFTEHLAQSVTVLLVT